MPAPDKDDKPSDQAIFREAMRGVKPLSRRSARIVPERPKPNTRPRHPKQEEAMELPETFALSDYEKLPTVGSESLLFYAKNGVSTKTIRNLRRGQYNPAATLDLHGRTVNEARRALGHFLQDSQADSLSCIRIIHGKGTGRPILKNRLNHWLREIPFVIAFCSINPGTLIVLIRRKPS